MTAELTFSIAKTPQTVVLEFDEKGQLAAFRPVFFDLPEAARRLILPKTSEVDAAAAFENWRERLALALPFLAVLAGAEKPLPTEAAPLEPLFRGLKKSVPNSLRESQILGDPLFSGWPAALSASGFSMKKDEKSAVRAEVACQFLFAKTKSEAARAVELLKNRAFFPRLAAAAPGLLEFEKMRRFEEKMPAALAEQTRAAFVQKLDSASTTTRRQAIKALDFFFEEAAQPTLIDHLERTGRERDLVFSFLNKRFSDRAGAFLVADFGAATAHERQVFLQILRQNGRGRELVKIAREHGGRLPPDDLDELFSLLGRMRLGPDERDFVWQTFENQPLSPQLTRAATRFCGQKMLAPLIERLEKRLAGWPTEKPLSKLQNGILAAAIGAIAEIGERRHLPVALRWAERADAAGQTNGVFAVARLTDGTEGLDFLLKMREASDDRLSQTASEAVKNLLTKGLK